MEKILSIGIPSYNAEIYLDRCLETFIHPSLEKRIEVFIVNDGSTDSTAEIGMKYLDMYPELFRLINKKNGGHGSAVNAGIEQATGRYYRVVDADDWVDTKELIKLVDCLEKTDADLISTHYNTVNMVTGKSEKILMSDVEFGRVYTLDELDMTKLNLTIHSTCYRTALLKEHNIKLQENTFFVDVEYQMLPFEFINTICFFDLFVYKYMIGNVNQSVNTVNFAKRFYHHDRVIKRMLDFVGTAQLNQQQRTYVEHLLVQVMHTHYFISCYYEPDKEKGIKQAKEFDMYLLNKNKKLYYCLSRTFKDIETLRNNNFDVTKIELNNNRKLKNRIKRTIKRILKYR